MGAKKSISDGAHSQWVDIASLLDLLDKEAKDLLTPEAHELLKREAQEGALRTLERLEPGGELRESVEIQRLILILNKIGKGE